MLDDDPTGVQTLAGLTVVLDWQPPRVAAAFEHGSAVHLLTNSRAFSPAEARALAASAARAVAEAAPEAAVVLRGDSTLRGHVLEEYLGVVDARSSAGYPPLLLAPALPTAGRVTVGGVQYLERGGARVPVHLTEFAADGQFSFRSSRLLEWAEERSAGLFKAADGIEVGLADVRSSGGRAVTEALERAARAARPTAIAADAETADDVAAVAHGFRLAVTSGVEVVLRCGPAVAGALGGATAAALSEMPSAEEVLLICGSYVAGSGRQLKALAGRYPQAMVEVDAHLLAAGDQTQLAEAAAAVSARLDSHGLAVLATPRARPSSLANLASGLQVADGVAQIVRQVDRPRAVIVVKGGVTSAVVLRNALRAVEADVIGPVLPGVALWRADDDQGRERIVVVVPGNVGEDGLLVRIIDSIKGEAEA